MEDPDRLPNEGHAPRKVTEGIVFDFARKAVASSVKSLLSTEEGLRAVVGAIVPKEVGQYVRGELSQLRKDFLEAVVRELTSFLERLDPATEIQKVLSGLTFDVHLTLGISKKEGGGRRGSSRDEENPAKVKTPRKAPKRKR